MFQVECTSVNVHTSESLPPSGRVEPDSRKWTLRRFLAASTLVVIGTALCAIVASISADVEIEPGEEIRRSRRLEEESAQNVVGCRLALPGDKCYDQIQRAIQEKRSGLHRNLTWNSKVTENSSVEEFQSALHVDPLAQCPRPCSRTKGQIQALAESALRAQVVGYEGSGRVVAQGQWCSASEPRQGWALRACGAGRGLQAKFLTYNLYWWNLFRLRNGNGGSAGRVIAEGSRDRPFDVMGFQECEDIYRVLGDAGLLGEFGALSGPHAMCLAFRHTAWNLLSEGARDVGEDRQDQWYGTRAVMWVRLQHKDTGDVVFFANHHGPLPVHTGGRCGGEATAYNMLQLIATEAQVGDTIVLVGDFNSGPQSDTVRSFNGHLTNVLTGSAFGGVDNVFTSCQSALGTRNLGSGGSDHDALEVVMQL